MRIPRPVTPGMLGRLALVLWLAAAAGAALPGAAGAAEPSRLDSADVRRWREDLAVLRQEMPRRHPNLFHAMTPAQFDSALRALDSALPASTRDEVLVGLMRLVALVGDGHSNVSAWRDSAIGFHELPVTLQEFADGVFVRAATRHEARLVGARVLRIGGASIDSALALARALVGADNAMGPRAWAPVLLAMPEVLHALGLARDPDRVPLTVERAGRRETVELRPAGPFPLRTGETDRSWTRRAGWVEARGDAEPTWLAHSDRTYWFTLVGPGPALYCQVNAIQQDPADSLAAFMARALAAADSAGADRFVLDLRLNGGGNGQWCPDIVRPLVKSRYDAPGRLYVLMGRRTWSAAEFLLCDLESWTWARFIGEPSAGRGNHYGDSRRLVLPRSHVTVRLSSLYWQFWDPRDDRPWIAPDIAAPLDFAAYRAGRDPALEAALAAPAGLR